jgi:hypothetical protein
MSKAWMNYSPYQYFFISFIYKKIIILD